MISTSIVIPVKNDPIRLRKLLNSLEPTDFEETEVIVVNDGSTDDTAQVAASYPVRVIATSSSGLGPASARNFGVDHAAGELIIFLDSDVVLDRGIIRRIRQRMTDEPQYAGLATITGMKSENPGFIPEYCAVFEQYQVLRVIRMFDKPNEEGVFERSRILTPRCGAIRKEIFQQLGGFKTSFQTASVEDLEFSVRLTTQYQVVLDPSLHLTHHWAKTVQHLLRRIYRNAFQLSQSALIQGKSPGGFIPLWEAVPRLLLAAGTLLIVPALVVPPARLVVAALLGGLMLWYIPLYRWFFRAAGLRFTIGAIVVHHLVAVAGALGAGLGVLAGVLGKKRAKEQTVSALD